MNLGKIDALFQERRTGHTLPQALYTSQDAFEFDVKAIYGQNWLMAGMECAKIRQLPVHDDWQLARPDFARQAGPHPRLSQ
jgi:hypothetical protein